MYKEGFTARDLKYFSHMFPALEFALETMKKQIFYKKTGLTDVGKIYSAIAQDTQKTVQKYLDTLVEGNKVREGKCTFDITITQPMNLKNGILVLEILLALDANCDLCQGLLYYDPKNNKISLEIN